MFLGSFSWLQQTEQISKKNIVLQVSILILKEKFLFGVFNFATFSFLLASFFLFSINV